MHALACYRGLNVTKEKIVIRTITKNYKSCKLSCETESVAFGTFVEVLYVLDSL